MKKIPLEIRIKKYIVGKENRCWEWIGATSEGYGVIGINGKNKQVRRVLFELNIKKIPQKECLRSLCKNKKCVNPEHHIISIDLMFSYINKNAENSCWEWTRCLSNKGYAVFNVKNKMILVHRFMYEKFKNKISNKMSVCHSCDNPKCVNPEHLFLGTHKENIIDCIKKGRDKKARGERQRKCSISEKTAIEIKTKFKEGKTIKEIYHLFDCSYQTVWNICKNRSWKYLVV